MKTISKFQVKRILYLICFITVFSSPNLFGQSNTYKTTANTGGTSDDKLGWKNHADLNIVTNDSSRVIVKKDGDVEIKKNLVVDGKITGDSIHVSEVSCDSIKISQYLTADSIHVNSIKIGDSSLWIGSTLTGTSDLIQSNYNAIQFGSNISGKSFKIFCFPNEIFYIFT